MSKPADDNPNETDAEQRHRLWLGVRRRGAVQWASIFVVLVLVVVLFWLARYLEMASF